MTRNAETSEKQLTYAEKLDVIITTLTEIVEKQDLLLEKQEELEEKVNNLSLSGDGFQDDFDS